MITPNWFAIFALLAWPLVAAWLYSSQPVGRATIWTILGAFLLLPVGASIKFQGIPSFDKDSIPNLAALFGCMLVLRRPPRFWRSFGVAELLLFLLLIAPFITAELNTDPIVLANNVLPAESHYDAVSAIFNQFVLLIPFFLGRQLLRSSPDNKEILRILVIAGLLYSLPMLWEIRMSPQLHTWIYGYFPHFFGQMIREGGFRPVVFMPHGLVVAFFAMTTTVAAAALWRTQTCVARLSPAVITGYLSLVLILCKSLGSLVYGALLVPLVRWTNPRVQVLVALLLASIALVYPLLRSADFIPTKSMVDAAAMVSADRAESLKTRFDQEQLLLEHASLRPLFGWGRWGRNRIYDAEYGKDISITDGHWIITIGQFGLFGFLAEFGLLVLPVFRAASVLKFAESKHDRIYFAALSLILAISVIDLLPNGFLTPWTWLLAGALLGRAESLRVVARERVKKKLYPTIASTAKVG